MPGSMEVVLLLRLRCFGLEAQIRGGGPAAGVHRGWPGAGPLLKSEFRGTNLASGSTWAGLDLTSKAPRAGLEQVKP